MKQKTKRLKSFKLRFFLLSLASVPELFCVTAHAEGAQSAVTAPDTQGLSQDVRRNLDQFIEAAEVSGHQLDEAGGREEFAKARMGFARSYGLPKGQLDMYFGPLPGASGNAVDGKTDWNNWGAFTVAKLELAQPLYTFGALGAGVEAAQAGVQAEKNLSEAARLKLRTEVAELYYSYQLAFELSELAGDIGNKLDDALKSGHKLRDQNKKGAPSLADLDKLSIYIADIRLKEQEALKGLRLARAAMAWKIGSYGNSEPKWDKANLQLRDIKFKTLEDYQKLASDHRPELLALEQDVKAKKALLQVEEGLTLPALYVAGQATYAVATQRTDQISPFAYDPLNDQSAAIVLGFRWNLGFFERRSKVSMARAELIQAEGRRAHYGAGIMVDVERAFLDAKGVVEAAEKRRDAAKAAKRVFNDSFVAFTLGTGPAKELLESLGVYGMAEKSRLEAIQQANLSTYKLEQAVGTKLDF